MLVWYLGIMIVKALVSYDGFNYAGWQKQENALGVQQVIEEALYKITKENVDVVASEERMLVFMRLVKSFILRQVKIFRLFNMKEH